MGINKTCKCLIDGNMKLHPCSSNCHLFGDCITAFCKANVKPLTNADHIRSMSDDELAELFDGIVDNGRSCILICGDFDNCKRNNSIERICKNHYLKWLKQPYKE